MAEDRLLRSRREDNLFLFAVQSLAARESVRVLGSPPTTPTRPLDSVAVENDFEAEPPSEISALEHPLLDTSDDTTDKKSPHHRRVASSGITTQLRPRQAKNRRSVLSQQTSRTQLSLEAVLEHSPFESEAEASIQRALEEIDPTKGLSMDPPNTILSHVPSGVPSELFEEASASQGRATTLPLHSKGRHRRTRTTAEDLWMLSSELRRIQDFALPLPTISESLTPRTNADLFVENATNIVKRHQALDVVDGFEGSASLTEAAEQSAPLRPPLKAESSSETDEGNTSPSSKRVKRKLKSGFGNIEDWMRFRRRNAYQTIGLAFFVMVPATIVAAIFYYACGNPLAAHLSDGQASASYWILFVGVRCVLMLVLANATSVVLIDYFSWRSRTFTRAVGPVATLAIVQSRGWPLVTLLFGIYSFIFLFGGLPFKQHWLYWQTTIGLFNENNPAGHVTVSPFYRIFLVLTIVVGLFVAIKRCWVGLYLGRQTFHRYGEDLAKVMQKILLVSEVGALARDIEMSGAYNIDFDCQLDGCATEDVEGKTTQSDDTANRLNLLAGIDMRSQHALLAQLLGEWEEPEEQRERDANASIASIIQFRQSLACLSNTFPFGVAFGPAATRIECVESSEQVYRRLLKCEPNSDVLRFDIIALLAVGADGELERDRLQDLIRLFRPDREGRLSLMDFAKSVDVCYRELRLLRANVASSSKLDIALERIIDVIFYVVLASISLAAMGVDPFVIFGSISAFVVGFAFMIGAACSTLFEGIVMILVRRPFDIGDRINVSQGYVDTPTTGSPGWVVKDLDLFSTTVVYGSTNEVATYSNGYLNQYRIINAARSNRATLKVVLKFPIDTSYQRVQIYRKTIEEFINARPREWSSLMSIRSTLIEADLGFVEYTIIAQHRDSWQNIGALMNSKSDLSAFALEVSKKMGMFYRAPPLPVDLTLVKDAMNKGNHAASAGEASDDLPVDIASVAAMFDTKTP